jgi:CheY-like chemotaxis protein
MLPTKLACLFHPISVLFVDDNASFVSAIEHALTDQGKILISTDPTQAIQMIKQSEATMHNTVAHVMEHIEAEKSSDFTVNLLIDHIHHAIYNPNRRQTIAVIFVDYLMPQMNGIEFCKTLKKIIPALNPEYVMLTAEADEQLAVEAFNAGWINKFLVKSADRGFNQKILDLIETSKQHYFHHLSQPMGVSE